MANEYNLIPVRTEKEARELGRNGGKASGEARRRKRDARKIMEGILRSVPVADKRTLDKLQSMGIKGTGKNKDQFDLELIASAALMQKAMRGDVRAHRLILEILGEDAASMRERERMEHEERMARMEIMAPDLPDDGFIAALNGVDAFAGMPPDEPMDLLDGEDEDEDA